MILRGQVVDMTQAEGFFTEEDGEMTGLITYILSGRIMEITSLDSLRPNQGLGTALINRVVQTAKEIGCRKIVVITTNDNLHALGFYQRRGFDLARLFQNALEVSRRLKPEIPLIGENNIPLRHEIELEMVIGMWLETERLIIRDLEPGDEAPFITMAEDGSLREIGFDADCQSWMKDWIAESKTLAEQDEPTRDYLAYAIVRRDDQAVIGSVGCSYYEDLQKVGITYFIGTEYRGKGYAAEAAKAYGRYFARHYPLFHLIATIRKENPASWKTIEKAGFRKTEERMYQDINDDKAELYYFYEWKD